MNVVLTGSKHPNNGLLKKRSDKYGKYYDKISLNVKFGNYEATNSYYSSNDIESFCDNASAYIQNGKLVLKSNV